MSAELDLQGLGMHVVGMDCPDILIEESAERIKILGNSFYSLPKDQQLIILNPPAKPKSFIVPGL